MDAIKCIKERRSIRSYIEKDIAKEILEDIVDCGRLAPSANNIQPCEFIIITKKDLLEKISKAATYGPFIKDSAACIVICGDESSGHLLEDGSASTENILLAAKAYNLGTCWIAGWKRKYNPQIKELLNIPENKTIVSIISLGYTEEKKEIKKKSLNEILHWDNY